MSQDFNSSNTMDNYKKATDTVYRHSLEINKMLMM